MNGCKYPGTPEPCEGYREAVEVLEQSKEALQCVKGFIDSNYATSEGEFAYLKQALTRINQLREKE